MKHFRLVFILIFCGLVLLTSTAFMFQEKLFFRPKKLAQDFAYSFKQEFEELFFTAADGAIINVLLFKAKNSKGIILYFHGNADNLERWGKYAEDFTKNNYDVLMMDYRGFGKSTGEQSEENFHADAELIYQYAKNLYSENKIVVYGRSLGSGIATKLAANHQPKLLLLETPYFNFIEAVQHFVPFFPVDVIEYTFRTDVWIQQIKCPVYYFHGTEDKVVPYEQGLKLAEWKNNSENLIRIEGGEHKNLRTFPKYHAELKRVLDEN